jgi:peptidoglycan hydrolase-like protein with peptidoglycan-binding domain
MANVQAPKLAPLRRDEVREVQSKLRSFGFDPGPVDGTVGPMTQGAARRYEQARGQQETGVVDRWLLDQLRQDPTPPPVVAQRAPSDVRRAAYTSRGSSSDPFEPLRIAGDRFSRWLQSLGR